MVKYYECLECKKEFPQISYTGAGKFCCADCYKAYRKVHGSEVCRDVEPILIRETDKRRRGRPSTKTAQVLDEIKTTEPEPTIDDKPKQNEDVAVLDNGESEQPVVSFCDLSINELREVLTDLLYQNDEQERMIEALNREIERLIELLLDQKDYVLKPLLEDFITNVLKTGVIETPKVVIREIDDGDWFNDKVGEDLNINKDNIILQQQHCPGCNVLFNPENEEQIFHNEECAQKFMENSHGVMRLYNGKVIYGKNEHGGKQNGKKEVDINT